MMFTAITLTNDELCKVNHNYLLKGIDVARAVYIITCDNCENKLEISFVDAMLNAII